MALRDYSLDDKIIASAFSEFSAKGYMGASLRKIAEKAGVTVGAIQTRYKSKDALFLSLLKPFLDDIEAMFQDIRADYYADAGTDPMAQLKTSMQEESAAILHLIFSHYREAVLLFYGSVGSSLEHYFDMIVNNKIEESISFFHSTGYTDVDEKLLGLLISSQFDSYRRIVTDCPDRETAEKYMSALMTYHFGGWVALFDSADKLQRKEDSYEI